jgi:hypothetical protein
MGSAVRLTTGVRDATDRETIRTMRKQAMGTVRPGHDVESENLSNLVTEPFRRTSPVGSRPGVPQPSRLY